jgi:hypothetical protein
LALPRRFFAALFALRVSLAALIEPRDDLGGIAADNLGRVPRSAAPTAIAPITPPMAAPTGPATTAPRTAPVTAAAGLFGIRMSVFWFCFRSRVCFGFIDSPLSCSHSLRAISRADFVGRTEKKETKGDSPPCSAAAFGPKRMANNFNEGTLL